jgi:hypothetical protein
MNLERKSDGDDMTDSATGVTTLQSAHELHNNGECNATATTLKGVHGLRDDGEWQHDDRCTAIRNTT